MTLSALVRAFADADVRYILIGGVAARVHGSSRLTDDVDVLYDTAPDNIERLGELLSGWRCTLRDAPPELPFVADARALHRMESLTLNSPFGKLDVFQRIPGVGTYSEALARTTTSTLEGRTVRLLTLEALIAAKVAADRPKDREQLPGLRGLLSAQAMLPDQGK